MDILDGLNEAQAEAVRHDEGPMLVVAGAGTGKTAVITRRIARLIADGKAKPGQILALTFTDKAAREMSERLEGLIGWDAVSVSLLTFNAFGTEILRNYASHIGRSIRGGLLNDTQKTILLYQHIDRIKLSYYGGDRGLYEFLESVVRYIGMLQNDTITTQKYAEYVKKLQENTSEIHPQDLAEQEDLLKLYQLYEEIKVETGSYDFSDQLLIPLQILQQKPNLVERLRAQYRYVLVDEYQDTNGVQDALLRLIVPSDGNLFAVGDDDQAIYGFRGARIDNILDFVEHFKDSRRIALTQNYRSGQEILDASYGLIQNNNPERLEAKLHIDKRLQGQREGSVAVFTPYGTQADEYSGVMDQIRAKLEAGTPAGDIAVLSATHAPLRRIAKGLREREIPYALSTVANIFEQTELLQLWYLLDLIGGRLKPEAIAHIVMSPYIGYSLSAYQRVSRIMRDQDLDFEVALEYDESEDSQELIQRLAVWRGWARDYGVSQLTYKLVFETPVAAGLIAAADTDARSLRVFEDLDRLLGQMQDYESVALDPTLEAYQAVFPKPPELEVSEPVGAADGVQLLTVHASKGLEFPIVYLIGLTQRSWSEGRGGGGGLKVPDELRRVNELPAVHEFRRVMYVALTRAKNELYLSAPSQTANGAKQTLSSFVEESGVPMLESQQIEKATKTDEVLSKLQRYYPLREAAENGRLPFETDDGWLELSVTALGGYDYCPYDFYLQHVLGIHHPFGPQLAFGTALHGVFEAYYKAKMAGNEMGAEEAAEILDASWREQGYETAEAAATAHALAHDTLKRFMIREASAERKVLGSEVGVLLEIPEAKLRLRGKIDAYFETAEGVELRDFKTGRKTDAEKLAADAKTNFQLRTYAVAYELLSGTLPASVTLDYVVTGVEGTAKITPLLNKNFREKLVKYAEAIRAKEFAPNTNAMHQCAAITYYGQEEINEG